MFNVRQTTTLQRFLKKSPWWGHRLCVFVGRFSFFFGGGSSCKFWSTSGGSDHGLHGFLLLCFAYFLSLICGFSPWNFLLYCGGAAISHHYTVSLVQWVNHLLPVQGVSSLRPGDAQHHNGTGFLLSSMSRYIGDPDVIDHGPRPRLRANNGKLHQASCRRCEKSAVITHCLPWFHSTPCRSFSSSQHSDQLEPQSTCWGGALWRPRNFKSLHRLTGLVGQPFASHIGVSGSRPGNVQTYSGTGFLLLVLSRYSMMVSAGF